MAVPDYHDIENFKKKREIEVRKNFQRYITEKVSKEGTTVHKKNDEAFYKRIEGDVDKVLRKMEIK